MPDYLPDMIRHYCVLYSQGISIVVAETSEKFVEGAKAYVISILPTLSCVLLDFYICMLYLVLEQYDV